VIPVGPNDLGIIAQQITHTQKNIIGYRHIYIIPCDPQLSFPGCITVPENCFPFTIDDMALNPKLLTSQRRGWYLQQLLKLYAGQVIPGIADKYLVIDADTFFLRPTTMIDSDQESTVCLYAFSSNHNVPYFDHMSRLHPSLTKIDGQKSGICHHMMFENKYLNELFDMVSSRHQSMPFWRVFLNCIDPNEYHRSGASKYELYYNFMLKYHPTQIKNRSLKCADVSELDFDTYVNGGYDYISYHHYNRK